MTSLPRIRLAIVALVAGMVASGACRAQPAPLKPEGATLERPDAFERAFAVSLYQFDACGDPLAGRMYRRALAERFARCPFTADARTRYAQRTRAQQVKVREWLDTLIETRGGLPVQVEGMSMTCHAHQATEIYQSFRQQLEQYAQGKLPADAIVSAACDASDLAP